MKKILPLLLIMGPFLAWGQQKAYRVTLAAFSCHLRGRCSVEEQARPANDVRFRRFGHGESDCLSRY